MNLKVILPRQHPHHQQIIPKNSLTRVLNSKNTIGLSLARCSSKPLKARTTSVSTPPLFLTFYPLSFPQLRLSTLTSSRNSPWETLRFSESPREGIGTKVLEYAFEEYGLDKEKVFLQTSMLSGNFYYRIGWKEVARRDVDLKDWGGKIEALGSIQRCSCVGNQLHSGFLIIRNHTLDMNHDRILL